MRIQIEKEQSSNLVLQLKVDDNTIQIPITANSKIEVSILEKDCVPHPKKRFCHGKFNFDELQETYAKELQILADRGYTKTRICLKLLSRCNGDVEKVCAIIEKRKKLFGGCKKERVLEAPNPTLAVPSETTAPNSVPESTEKPVPCRKAKWLEKIAKLKETYATQLEQLSQMGFDNTRVNLRLLKRLDGDLNRVIEELLSGKDFGRRGGWCGFGDPEKLKALESEYATQLAYLNQHGFDKLRRNVIALKKHDGNQETALKWLQQGGPCAKWKKLKEEYASQLEELAKRGFQNPRMRLVSLKKCNGDVDLATEWLKTHQPKRDC